MEKTKNRKGLTVCLSIIAVILALLCVCRIFFIDWYTVSGGSMQPTYQDGQTVFARKVGGANRFDAVVIDADDLMSEGKIDSLFKRVVAVEGDEIWSEQGVLCVLFDGEVHRYADESYGGDTLPKIPIDIQRQTVPKGYVYVLGDNRLTSIDSRVFGFVSVDDIEAVVL